MNTSIDLQKDGLVASRDDRSMFSVLKKSRTEPQPPASPIFLPQESKRKLMLSQILTSEAMTKLFQIARGKPTVAKSIEDAIIYGVHMRQIVGKVSEDKLSSLLEQIKANAISKGTQLKDINDTNASISSGLSSKKRIFGSPCQVQSPMTDSHILETSPRNCSSHLMSTSKHGFAASTDQHVVGTSDNHKKEGRGPASSRKFDKQLV